MKIYIVNGKPCHATDNGFVEIASYDYNMMIELGEISGVEVVESYD